MELLEEILSTENLNEAYKRVYANKGASGVDGVSVEELHEHLRVHKAEILESIHTRTYKPQPVRRVEIPKETSGWNKEVWLRYQDTTQKSTHSLRVEPPYTEPYVQW